MGLIRKLAVKTYRNELNKFIEIISKASTEEVAKILVYGVWLKAILEVEGNLPTLKEKNEELIQNFIVIQ